MKTKRADPGVMLPDDLHGLVFEDADPRMAGRTVVVEDDGGPHGNTFVRYRVLTDVARSCIVRPTVGRMFTSRRERFLKAFRPTGDEMRTW